MMLIFRPKLIVLACALTVTGVAVGGCKTLSSMHLPHWGHKDPAKELCEEHAPYLAARSVPTLRVGDGLTPPNTHNAIKIPDGPSETHEHTVKEGCLDSPPPFDSGSKAKAPTAPLTPAKPAHDAPGN
jgi:uncharacterized lipoprotein